MGTLHDDFLTLLNGPHPTDEAGLKDELTTVQERRSAYSAAVLHDDRSADSAGVQGLCAYLRAHLPNRPHVGEYMGAGSLGVGVFDAAAVN